VRKFAPCSVDGCYAEVPVRREHAALLVAAVEKVEQRRRRHDRHTRRTDGKSTALLAQPGLYAAGRVDRDRI
jgi:hypothetical protein